MTTEQSTVAVPRSVEMYVQTAKAFALTHGDNPDLLQEMVERTIHFVQKDVNEDNWPAISDFIDAAFYAEPYQPDDEEADGRD